MCLFPVTHLFPHLPNTTSLQLPSPCSSSFLAVTPSPDQSQISPPLSPAPAPCLNSSPLPHSTPLPPTPRLPSPASVKTPSSTSPPTTTSLSPSTPPPLVALILYAAVFGLRMVLYGDNIVLSGLIRPLPLASCFRMKDFAN
ncbi:hypothetical protein RHGRI_007584 [Rhododendron griersonianum]|uniref:Uncharacterized protein n=1 Tax=Rhododendron griersonianum TaxID=479676 RepID=A0AAV6KY25_9ERIC|nr:hypothetical protein RHGRI_007584 [Rhododendron griersonianum]